MENSDRWAYPQSLVRDRVVQTAAKLILEPIFEADFEDCSYGFRPKRSARDALDAIEKHRKRHVKHLLTDRVPDIDLLEQFGVQQLHLISHQPIPVPLTQSLGTLACYFRKLPESANRILCQRGAEELAAVLEASPRQEIISPAASGPVEILEGGFAAVLGMRRYEIRGLDKSRLRLKATIRVEHGGRLHVDSIDFYSARSRRHLCRDLCGIFNEASHVIEADIHRLLLLSEAHDPDRADAVTTANVDPATLMTANERRAAESFGKKPDLIERILADYRTCGLIGEECNKLLCYLAAISRKTGDPLSVLILSSSGAGKSALQDATLNLCPPEDVVKLTSLTGNGADPVSIQHLLGHASLRHLSQYLRVTITEIKSMHRRTTPGR